MKQKKLIAEILEHSKKTKSILSARQLGDSSNQFVGYILDFDDKIFIMQQVTTKGLKDGLLIEAIDNIETFEKGDYEDAYGYLFNNIKILSEQTVGNLKLPKSSNWKFEILRTLFKLDKIITIQLKTDDNIVTGMILEMDETHLKFNPLTNVGKDEGTVIYAIDNISTFTVDELESRKIKVLNEWRKKKA